MFLLRLWWAGPGRGHMKGSLCQATKMFSLSLMKTRIREQTWEHACHALYKQWSYSTILLTSLLFFSCSSKVDKVKGLIKWARAVIKKQQYQDNGVRTWQDRQIKCLFSLSLILEAIAFCPCGSMPMPSWFSSVCAWKSFLLCIWG